MSDTVDPSLVRHVGKLARISLSGEQVERFAKQLGQVLDYVRQLNELDVSGVEPMAHALDISNVLGEDQPRESLGPEVALSQAPARDAEFYLVPRVLGDEELTD